MTYSLGRGYAPDKRDRKYRFKRKRTRRTYRYWREGPWSGDQQDTPHCVGFAWAHWLSCSPIYQRLNPDGVYRYCKFDDEWEGEDYGGTSVRAGASVLMELGFIREYQWEWEIDGLVNMLLTSGPVVVGTDWYDDMFHPDTSGRIWASGEWAGGHAYLVSGVNTNTGLFRLKNSWGRNWGKSGHAYVGFNDMAELIAEDGECCLAVEKKPGK